DDLEAEAIQYRSGANGYAPAWEAEREAIAVEAAGQLRAVETEQRILRETQADLDVVRKRLQRVAPAAPAPIGASRRAASSSPQQPRRRRKKAKAIKRGATKVRVMATRRHRPR